MAHNKIYINVTNGDEMVEISDPAVCKQKRAIPFPCRGGPADIIHTQSGYLQNQKEKRQ